MSAHKRRISTRVVKNDKESNEKLIGRFQKRVQGSRIITLAKEKVYFRKKLRKPEQRTRAMMRDAFRAQREKAKYL